MTEKIARILEDFSGSVEPVDDLRDELAYRADREAAHEFIRRLRDEAGFSFLSFVTAVDNYLDEPRFEVVYCLRSMEDNVDLRINAPVPGENPSIATVTDLFPTANWLEREVFDMFGIDFADHPDMTRILMPDEFEGHPLRKDYPLLGNTPGTPGHLGKGGKL